MSRPRASGTAVRRRSHALVFAALGDDTRLALVKKLSNGRRHSIAHLTEGSRLTRQAITKHLRVLESAGIAHGVREGRESLFQLDPQPLEEVRGYLNRVSRQWDEALRRLQRFVEE